MCNPGTYKKVTIINPGQSKRVVVVDSCIANEIQELNDKGVITLGCCCGHGKAGEITEWVNAFGKWKGNQSPPNTLIDEASVNLAIELGYRPFPYFYADGEQNEVWQMYLKTGCISQGHVKEWHEALEMEGKD